MLRFAARRLLVLVGTVLVMTFAYFLAFHYAPFPLLAPFHPGEELLPPGATPKQYAAFDALPVLDQYWHILRMWLSGDLGYTGTYHESTATMIANALPYTAVLVASALVLGLVIGIPVGVVRALRHGGAFDRTAGVIATLLSSIPVMLSGQLLVIWFVFDGHLLSAEGPQGQGFGAVFGDYPAMILPVLSLGSWFAGRATVVVTSAMLDQIVADYLRTAIACGASPIRLLTRHLSRNVAGPVVIFIGTSLPVLISASVVLEAQFNMPGLGYLLLRASGATFPPPDNPQGINIDFPVQFTILLVIIVVTMTLTLIADLVAMLVDPRTPRR